MISESAPRVVSPRDCALGTWDVLRAIVTVYSRRSRRMAMDGGRRRRRRSAAEMVPNVRRAAWYAWWRSVRFAAHFGGWERFEPVRFVAGPVSWRACPEDLPRSDTTLVSPGALRTGLCTAPGIPSGLIVRDPQEGAESHAYCAGLANL